MYVRMYVGIRGVNSAFANHRQQWDKNRIASEKFYSCGDLCMVGPLYALRQHLH